MKVAERLVELIRIPTISAYDPSGEDASAFDAFPRRLAELYPAAHAAMEQERIGDRSIVYRWDGTEPDLDPVLGLAHYDVVPPGDSSAWTHPPFDGVIVEGRIHGRGSLDDKGMLAAWMEAVDHLVSSGFRPRRTLYLAFGGDEETTGVRGAGRVAAAFAERGLRFAFVLDEGGAIAVDQLAAFTPDPVALVGIAEKGYLTLRLRAAGMSGHASSPPKSSAIGRLGAAVQALERRPATPRLTEAPAGMLQALGEVAKGPRAFLMRNSGVFARILARGLSADRSTAPLVRTTLAPTVVRGGDRDNVLPDTAEALVNLRLLPGDTVAAAISRVERIIAGAVSEGVAVEPVEGSVFEPVAASGGKGPWWDAIARQVRSLYPGVVVAPYLMTGTTDSRWYRDLSDAIYRFIPMEVTSDEMSCVHSENESVSLESWEKSVDFLVHLMNDVLDGYESKENRT